MDPSRTIVWATVGVILTVTIASGPLVPWIDFTAPSSNGAKAPLGTGSASIQVVETPDTATLEKGEFGAGAYYLRVPDSTIQVASVSGRPTLAYKIRIDELGHVRLTSYAIDDSWVGEKILTLESSTIPPEEIDKNQYFGDVLLVLRGDGEEEILIRKNVTVIVRE